MNFSDDVQFVPARQPLVVFLSNLVTCSGDCTLAACDHCLDRHEHTKWERVESKDLAC